MALRAEVPDEVRAHQDSGADAAEEQEQHPDGVEVGLNQPECADDQPEQDDQGHRSNVSAAHRSDTSGITLAAAATCTRSAMAVHIAWWLCRRNTGIQLTGAQWAHWHTFWPRIRSRPDRRWGHRWGSTSSSRALASRSRPSP